MVSETFSIEDCWKYDSNTYTSNQTLNIPLPTGDFSVEFIICPSSRTSSWNVIAITGTDNKTITIGQQGSNGYIGLVIENNGSRVIYNSLPTYAALNNDTVIKYTYINGTHTLTGLNNETTSYNYPINHEELTILSISNNKFTKLKIKPL